MYPQHNIPDILRNHPWFSSCSDDLLRHTADTCTINEYNANELIGNLQGAPSLCILLSGSATVLAKEEGSDLLLRVLATGDTFGVADLLFGKAPQEEESAVTRIVANTDTCVLCMPRETMRAILVSDSEVALKYIDFLSNRIRFLNRRIACLGAGSSKRRLIAYLDNTIPTDTNKIFLSVPMKRLGDILGLGRASLYRAFDELCDAGYLTRDGRTVCILDRLAMRHDAGLV